MTRAKRDEIPQAARPLVAARPFEDVTVLTPCVRAEVGKGGRAARA